LKTLKLAVDLGGVLSKYPDIFKKLLFSFDPRYIDVYIISDIHPKEKILEALALNYFDNFINSDNVFSADYDKYGEAAKAVLCKELEIDIFIDDFIGYLSDKGAPVRLLVMPDSSRPYWSDDWKTNDEVDFGRRKYNESAGSL